MIDPRTVRTAVPAVTRWFATRRRATLALLLIVGLWGSPARARVVVMHGYADATSALVWVQRALADFLLAQRIEGLLFVSGDRHFTELLRVDRPGAYPLYEFTSSPLTASPWESPEAGERNNPQVVAGTLVGKRQFGLIRISGPGNARRIALESYDQTGTLRWQQTLRASELRFPRKPAAQ